VSLSLPALFAIVFLTGAILFVVGSIVVRASKIEQEPMPAQKALAPALEEVAPARDEAMPQWIVSLGAEQAAVDVAGRIELVERLAMVGEQWCVQMLQEALHEERDRRVAAAIRSALKDLR